MHFLIIFFNDFCVCVEIIKNSKLLDDFLLFFFYFTLVACLGPAPLHSPPSQINYLQLLINHFLKLFFYYP